MKSHVSETVQRPLLPPWASVAMTLMTAVAVASLILHLVSQNRALRDAQSGSVSVDVPRVRTPRVGETLPEVEVVSLDGMVSTVSGLVEERTVVAFMTTTCEYCEASLGMWGQMAERLKPLGIPFVMISLDDLNRTASYALAHSIDWPVWTTAPERRAALGVNTVPLTLIVSPDGRVRMSWPGQMRRLHVDEVLVAAAEADGP